MITNEKHHTPDLALAEVNVQPFRILNLYAGIGGNRKLWQNVEVTAIEFNEEIAMIYQDHYPDDELIITDAHKYLLENYNKFDFIWSYPPCQTHSAIREMGTKKGLYEAKFPDPKLWQEITFLKHFAPGKFVVENVIPYYEPFIRPTAEIERHYFWSNFNLPKTQLPRIERVHKEITGKTILYGYDLTKYKIKHRKDQILRNCVNPELGLYVLNCARNVINESRINQPTLFGANF